MSRFLNILCALSISCALLQFADCASSAEEMKAAMDPWIGQGIETLMMKWGTPTNVFQMPNGFKIYTWLYNGGSQASAYYLPNINYGYASAQNIYCRIDWTVNNSGVIIDYRYEGSCKVTHN